MKKIYPITICLFVCNFIYAQTWFPIGTGVNNMVYASYTDTSTNKLYLGGFFTDLNGISATSIIQFDGISWSAMGNGLSGGVRSIFKYNNEIYAGGFFNGHVAKWNGSSWLLLNGLGSGNFSVESLAEYNGELYAGGTFDTTNGSPFHFIARWNGSSWHDADGGFTSEPGSGVFTMQVYNGILYAGGNIYRAINANSDLNSGTLWKNIAKWNGTIWSKLGPGTNGSVSAFAIYNNELYVGGAFNHFCGYPCSSDYICKWNGLSWSNVGLGMNSHIRALRVLNGQLFAGGLFTLADSIPSLRVAKWDGNNWSPVSNNDFNNWVAILQDYQNSLYAGGLFDTASGAPAHWIAKSSTTIGINESFGKKNSIAIFPNPATTEVTINFGKAACYGVQLCNTLGEVLEQTQINSAALSLNIGSYTKGIYFITVTDENKNKVVRKIVKM